MKRVFWVWALTLFPVVFLAPLGFAYDSGRGTRDPLFSLDFLTHVQERDVVEKGEALDPLFGLKVRGNADSTRLLVRGGFRPVPSLELYGLVGGADLRIDEFDGFDASMSVAYGGGLHLVLYQSPFPRPLELFVDAQYLQYTAKDHLIVDGVPQDEEIRWREYVAKVGVDSDRGFIRPYGGLRFSLVRARDILSSLGELKLREDDIVGIFGGTDIFLDPTKRAALNLEFSLFDVNSVSVGLRLAF